MFITESISPGARSCAALGATLALPLLDAWCPRLLALARRRPRRREPARRHLRAERHHACRTGRRGARARRSRSRRSSSRWRRSAIRSLIVSGLANQPAVSLPGEGAGDHARAAATFLTGVQPKKTEGAGHPRRHVDGSDRRAGARQGHAARLARALPRIATSSPARCDAGYSCAYANTLAWRTPTTPLPMENDPRAVFERLFGDSDSTDRDGAARADPRKDAQHPRLGARATSAACESGSARATAPSSTEYLDAIRDVERRIQKAEAAAAPRAAACRPAGRHPATFDEHAQADVRSAGARVPERHDARDHVHAGARERARAPIRRSASPTATTAFASPATIRRRSPSSPRSTPSTSQLFAYFLDKLKSTPDGDGYAARSLRSLLYGCGHERQQLAHAHRPADHRWPAAAAAGSRADATSATRRGRR